jgi:hypothetical protein
VSLSLAGNLGVNNTPWKTNTPIAVGAAFLGFLAIGAAIWWWRSPDDREEEPGQDSNPEMDLDQTLNAIALLDQSHEKGGLDDEEYQQSRQALRQKAKALLEQKDAGIYVD